MPGHCSTVPACACASALICTGSAISPPPPEPPAGAPKPHHREQSCRTVGDYPPVKKPTACWCRRWIATSPQVSGCACACICLPAMRRRGSHTRWGFCARQCTSSGTKTTGAAKRDPVGRQHRMCNLRRGVALRRHRRGLAARYNMLVHDRRSATCQRAAPGTRLPLPALPARSDCAGSGSIRIQLTDQSLSLSLPSSSSVRNARRTSARPR